MSKKRHKAAHRHTRQEKKGQFQPTQSQSSSKSSRIVALVVILGMGIAILYVIFGGGGSEGPTGESFQAVAAPGQDVRIPVSDVSDGRAKFYNYTLPSNREISFFVVKSSDGVVRAAFDACDVCFKSHKGYWQEGDDVVCNNCGRHFPSVSVNEVQGGCNPAPLARAVEGDQLVIKASD
ncbi:MAG: DUF2318 domain-containing protein [Acidobacteria bacterium]|nr:DUF2318 domain-containing protein [Acidobacteriota bacterium]